MASAKTTLHYVTFSNSGTSVVTTCAPTGETFCSVSNVAYAMIDGEVTDVRSVLAVWLDGDMRIEKTWNASEYVAETISEISYDHRREITGEAREFAERHGQPLYPDDREFVRSDYAEHSTLNHAQQGI